MDKEINKELPEDDLIEDRNMLECFLKCFKWTEVQLMSPHSTHYRHTKHTLPHNHDGLIILFKYFNSF